MDLTITNCTLESTVICYNIIPELSMCLIHKVFGLNPSLSTLADCLASHCELPQTVTSNKAK